MEAEVKAGEIRPGRRWLVRRRFSATTAVKTARRRRSMVTLGGLLLVAFSSVSPGAGSRMAAPVGSESPLPRLEMTRYLDTGGTQSYRLQCRPDATASAGMSCRLSLYRDAREIDGKWIDAKAASPQISRWVTALAPFGSRTVAGGDPLLHWEIEINGRRFSGFLPKEGKRSTEREKVLNVEAELITPLYE